MSASLDKNKHIKRETEDSLEIGEEDVRELDPRIYSMGGLDVEITHTDRTNPVKMKQLFPTDSSQAPSKTNSDAKQNKKT